MPAGDKYLINEIARKTQMITDLINENEELAVALHDEQERCQTVEELLTTNQQKKLEVLLQDQAEPS